MGRKVCLWGVFLVCFAASANKFYSYRQYMYKHKFILQSQKYAKQLPNFTKKEQKQTLISSITFTLILVPFLHSNRIRYQNSFIRSMTKNIEVYLIHLLVLKIMCIKDKNYFQSNSN